MMSLVCKTKIQDLSGSNLQLYLWIQKYTKLCNDSEKVKVTTPAEIVKVTPHIRVDHKLEKIKRYIVSVHGKSHNIILIENEITSLPDIKNQIQLVLAGIVDDNNFFYNQNQIELQIVYSSKIACINIGDNTVSLALARQPSSPISICQYDGLHSCLAIIYNGITQVICTTGRSSKCTGVLGSRVIGSVCRPCKENERVRKRNADGKAVEKTFKTLDTISPEFGGHIRNQLKRIKNPNEPYDKSILNACLRSYIRDKRDYVEKRETKVFGTLPHPSLLQRYKNRVTQDSGIVPGLLDWMSREGERLQLNDNERLGGLIFDEMAIQAEVTLSSQNKQPVFYGFRDHGEDLENVHAVYDTETSKTSSKSNSLPNKVLQFIFSGLSGFKFAVAHYPTTSMTAKDLRYLIDQIITALAKHNFQVIYVMMDGASVNRSIVKGAVQLFGCYSIPNINEPGETVTYIMDPKHTLKKIRNSLLKSGGPRRTVKSSTGLIIWDHWRRLKKWSDDQVVSICVLTEDHINPVGTLKMRNSLAEQCLDRNILDSMKIYQRSLAHPEELAATIELLEHTSKMVDIYLDTSSSVRGMTDKRVSDLRAAANYFSQFSGLDPHYSFTNECTYDTLCTLKGVLELVKSSTRKKRPLILGYVNSDVIENHFSMCRSLYNGASQHPNYFGYKSIQNSIILCQPVGLSNKRNAASSNDIYIQP